MRMAREWMSATYLAVTGTGGGTVSASGRDRYALYFYIASLVLSLLLSFVGWLITPPAVVLFVFAIVWGLFFGVTFLYWMPGKMLTTVFGALLGMIGSDLSAAPGAITKTNKQVEAAFIAIFDSADQFSAAAMWLFIFIVAALCLPAFFEKGVVPPQ